MLITFEGLDGCGKSTQARRLVEQITQRGLTSLLVREPGGTPLSEQIRALLLDPGNVVAPLSELLLFSAARHQLVADAIAPALDRGEVVVCDRFYDSTVAYQGGGRGVADPEWLTEFSLLVTGGLRPHRTIYLAVDPETARRRGTPGGVDRIEAGGEAFFGRVAQAYERLVAAEPARFLKLDGERPIDEIAGAIWADIEPRLPGGTGPGASGLPDTNEPRPAVHRPRDQDTPA